VSHFWTFQEISFHFPLRTTPFNVLSQPERIGALLESNTERSGCRGWQHPKCPARETKPSRVFLMKMKKFLKESAAAEIRRGNWTHYVQSPAWFIDVAFLMPKFLEHFDPIFRASEGQESRMYYYSRFGLN
jgi:hypothetical protein